MTTRKTVTLQRNVTKLNQTLSLKDQRIQLLNARLAELQQQLQAQQQTHKQNIKLKPELARFILQIFIFKGK